jgi:hypothetical protein
MALLPLLLSLAGVCGRTRAVKPNVLFVVVDDLAPAFEAYGSVGPPLLYTSCMESAILQLETGFRAIFTDFSCDFSPSLA